MNRLESCDLTELADAIAARHLSATEATVWALSRLETTGRQLNAVFRIDRDAALQRAGSLDAQQAAGLPCGSLHGVPLAHKDLLGVLGRECHGGSLILRGATASQTAWAIDRLDAAGQVNLGSLHMAEFALSPTGFNAHYGHGLNPWNTDYACGGSSSGSGIAVAARLVFGSLGTDTGGSIRHPAAMCGVTGLKPTWRRVGTQGVLPLSQSLDCVGPLAQSARDCARLLWAIAVPDTEDAGCSQVSTPNYEAALNGDLRGLRIGLPQAYFRDDLDVEVAGALDESVRVLSERGATVVNAQAPDMALINALAQILMSVEAAALHRRWMEERPDDYAQQVLLRIDPGFLYPAVRYVEALSLRRRITEEFLQLTMNDCDLIHVPTLPVLTPTIADTSPDDAYTALRSVARVTHATRGFNYLGLPAISVPAGFSLSGLPLAIQLVGRPFDEARLLQVADAFQRDTDWHRRRPVVAAT